MIDFDQLLGSVKAVENLDRKIKRLNMEKSLIMRRANACGLDRVALRDILRMRRRGECPDDLVPSTYVSLARMGD